MKKNSDSYEVVIYRAKQEDFIEMEKVEGACFSTPWSRKSMEESVATGRSFYLIAKYQNRIIGQCGVHNVCKEGEITNVAVLKEFRGRGIGELLLKELLDQGLNFGIEEFTLEVRSGNKVAISLYQKLGFKTEGVRKNFYEKPREDAMIMWKRKGMDETITNQIGDKPLYNEDVH